jgi:hypothetical protein
LHSSHQRTGRSSAWPAAADGAFAAASTAAAGALGADIKRGVPLKRAATSPKVAAPNMPAIAPCAPKALPRGKKIVTPKAMADGKATSIADKPPQRSPMAGCGCANERMWTAWLNCHLQRKLVKLILGSDFTPNK